MDYTGKKCPICSEKFKADDDIVVCPKCGAPYHRSCYEKEGRCIFLDLHRSNEAWKDEEDDTQSEQENTKTKKCRFCGHMNDENAVACEQCGRSFIEYQYQNMNDDGGNPNQDFEGFPGGFGGGMPIKIDLMAGVKPDEDFDGVSGEELSKYVKNNTIYYMGIFKRIKDTGKSRFNFAAFLFGGGWMLYRKKYVSGGILTAIMAVLAMTMTYVTYFVSASVLDTVAQGLNQAYPRGYTVIDFFNAICQLPFDQGLIAILPYALSFLNFVIMLIIGFTANRSYYKFVIKQIKSIKAEQSIAITEGASDDSQVSESNKKALNEKLMEKGGTNNALAVCLLVCDLLLSFLPQLFIH